MGSSDLYKIYTSRENYFVRLNRAGTQSQANIDAEIDFLKFCNFNGVLISTPICDIEGVIVQQTQTPEGAQPATIFPEIAGNSISKQLPKQLKNFGRQVAFFARLWIDCSTFWIWKVGPATSIPDATDMDEKRVLRTIYRLEQFLYEHVVLGSECSKTQSLGQNSLQNGWSVEHLHQFRSLNWIQSHSRERY